MFAIFRRPRTLHSRQHRHANAGFTLIEVLVVIIIVGILAAIAGPSWLTFLNQRRINAVNDALIQALREAQSEAQNTKLSHSVSIRNQNGIPEIIVHPETLDPDSPNTADNPTNQYWNTINKTGNLSLRANQVMLQTNLDNENILTATPDQIPNNSTIPGNPGMGLTEATITFDHTGALAEIDGVPPEVPIAIFTSMPVNQNATPLVRDDLRLRCVTIQSLIGSIVVGRGATECDNLI